MENHHKESIEKFLDIYQTDTTILAVLLGGSIAHGFAKPEADIDLLILVDEAEYEKRKQAKKLAFSLLDICTYEGGYIDCKIVSTGFLQKVSERGSDPARYAFQDCQILYSRLDDLEPLLQAVTRFPIQDKETRRDRFAAQLLAWRWFYSEAVKKENSYLTTLSIQKLVLFSCRLILNENELLYPYHKWLLRVTENAGEKPAGFDEALQTLMKNPDLAFINQFCDQLIEFLKIDKQTLDWPNHFLRDSEQNWLAHEAPIDDL